MIKINNLTKVFKAKKKQPDVVALDNLSVTLPDKGFIFITGKSGSGKSTLLNIIGGLASATSGDIVVDGNEITKFKNKDLNKYRASHIGFIFQDYHLIDELTVEQNIKCFAKNDTDVVFEDVLKTVDLVGCEKRYPMQLSGGQKQRVAIARALMKNSALILCDEPTGNLDKETSKQILKELKNISKKRLVVIVSHNQNDAEIYGDRIIELDAGRIISDLTKEGIHAQKTEIVDGEVRFNYGQDVSKGDIEKINEAINANEVINFSQKDNGFVPTEEIQYEENKIIIKKTKLAKNPSKTLFKSFFLSNKTNSIVTTLLTVLMIMVFSIIQGLAMFDTNDYTNSYIKSINDPGVILKNNEGLANYYEYPITEDHKEMILDAGYKGNIYDVYRYSLFGNKYFTSSGDYSYTQYITSSKNKTNFYLNAGFGTISCDMEYLTNVFGTKGKINVLHGSIEDTLDNTKVIISDYFADCLIRYSSGVYKTREDLMKGPLDYDWLAYGNIKIGEIGAIIDTDYEEKYAPLIQLQQEIDKKGDNLKQLKDEYLNHELLTSFTSATTTRYGYCYTLNPNFINEIKSLEKRNFTSLSNYYFENDSGSYQCLGYVGILTTDINERYNLPEGHMAVSYQFYNYIFGTNYTSKNYKDFTPVSYKLKQYRGDMTSDKVLIEMDITISKLHNNGTYLVGVHNDDLLKLIENNINTKLLILDDTSNCIDVLKACESRNVSSFRDQINRNVTLDNFITSFYEFFVFIEVLLVILILFYLISFSIKGITQYRYQIGILKAMGVKTLTLCKIFVSKMFIIATLISALSIVGITLFSGSIDTMLVATFEDVLRREYIGLHLVSLSPEVIMIDIIMIALIIIISAVLPILIMRNIKPIDILRERE